MTGDGEKNTSLNIVINIFIIAAGGSILMN